MTEYEVRELLKSIKTETEKMQKKIEQIEELRAVAESCTVRTDKEPIQTSGSGDKMGNIVGRMVDLEREIKRIYDDVEGRKRFLTENADRISNDRYSQYIKHRFIECNGFYDVVMIMDLADSTARRIDRRSVLELTKVINSSNHNI